MRSVFLPERRVLCLLSLALAAMILFVGQVRAQVAGATLSGTINDPSGAVVSNAQVAARNTATGVTRTANTDAAGFYSIPNLLPGNYEVTVTASVAGVRDVDTVEGNSVCLKVGLVASRRSQQYYRSSGERRGRVARALRDAALEQEIGHNSPAVTKRPVPFIMS